MGGAGHEEGETHAAAPAALPLASPEEDLPYEFYYEVGETLRPGEGDSLDVPQELSSGFTLSPSQPWTEDSVSVGVLQRVREHVYKLLEEGSLSEADLQHLLDCAMSVGFPDTSAIRCQSPEMTPGRAPLSSEPLKRSLAVPWVMDGSDAEVPTSSLTKHDLLHLEGALLEMKRRLSAAERDTREHRPRLSSQTVEARSPPSWTPGPCHTRLYHDAEYRKLRLASLQEQAEAREKRRAEQTLRSVRTSRSKTGTELPFLERVHLLMVKKKSEEDARRRLEEKRRRDEEAKLQKEPLRRSSQDILQHVAKLMSRHKASRARIESQHGAKLKAETNYSYRPHINPAPRRTPKATPQHRLPASDKDVPLSRTGSQSPCISRDRRTDSQAHTLPPQRAALLERVVQLRADRQFARAVNSAALGTSTLAESSAIVR